MKQAFPLKGHYMLTFLKIVSQSALECISAHVHFKKFPEKHAPRPLRELGLSATWNSPSSEKSDIES